LTFFQYAVVTVDCLFCMHFSRTITWDCSVAEWAVLLWC